MEEPEARVRAEITLVVPLPEIALLREPERFNVELFVIAPMRLSAEEVR